MMIMLFLLVLNALSATGELVHTAAGRRVTIKCGLNNFVNKLEWLHGKDIIIRISGRNRIPQKGVKEGDAGQFTCIADYKREEHTLAVFTVWVEPPGFLHAGGQATLNCRVSGLPLDTVVQWRGPDGSHHPSSSASLNPVEASHNGIWRCMITNDASTYAEMVISVQASTTTPFQIFGGTSPAPREGLVPEPTLWSLAAGGSVVVFLLLVLVLVLFLRVRRMKKISHQTKNPRKSLNSRQYCHCRCPPAAVAAAPPQKKKPPPPPLPAFSAQK
uniref:uncharacterized protein LOC131105196 isoform X2 n=1 Tax=Doryrhamphus excisus TaxID=161450 RepID=UPI0025AE5372|nr:uncharacterized protein LOC131105196 isoform X2 [Doryrhamphus excisus]